MIFFDRKTHLYLACDRNHKVVKFQLVLTAFTSIYSLLNYTMETDFTSNKDPLADRNLYIIISVTLIAIMGGQTIAPILPSLTEVFDVSPKEIELVMTVFVIPIGIATPILGILADRIGIRKVLVPSLLLFAIAGGCSSFAQDFHSLLRLSLIHI